MCDPLAPFFRSPVSKLPSEAVAVWAALSWLVHVTVSPSFTVTVAGAKAKFLIVTAFDPAARAVGLVRGAAEETGSGAGGAGVDVAAGCAGAGAGAAWAGAGCAAGSGAGAGAGAVCAGAGSSGGGTGVVAVVGSDGGSSAAQRSAGMASAATRK